MTTTETEMPSAPLHRLHALIATARKSVASYLEDPGPRRSRVLVKAVVATVEASGVVFAARELGDMRIATGIAMYRIAGTVDGVWRSGATTGQIGADSPNRHVSCGERDGHDRLRRDLIMLTAWEVLTNPRDDRAAIRYENVVFEGRLV